MNRIAFAVAVPALALFAACAHHTATNAATASGSRTGFELSSCHQQYQAWEHGQGKGILAALNAVSRASTSGNPQKLTDALDKAQPAVASAAVHPIPACADPRGYWTVLMMHVSAATANRGTPASVEAAMQNVPAINAQLTTEVQSTSR